MREPRTSRQLFPHQREAVATALAARSLLLIRALGSGKTAIALHLADDVLASESQPALYVCPAHLLTQLEAERQLWGLPRPVRVIDAASDFRFASGSLYAISYDRLRQNRQPILSTDWSLVLVDEFHRAKNQETQNFAVLRSLRTRTKRFVGMTGAPFQNGPKEFFTLVSLIAGRSLTRRLEDCLAYRREEVGSWLTKWLRRIRGVRPNRGPVVGISDATKLRATIQQYVDYLPPQAYCGECGLPDVISNITEVPLSVKEYADYKRLQAKYRKRKQRALFDDGLADGELESACKQMSDLRQILLCHGEEPSSKTRRLCEDTKTIFGASPEHRCLIFTNFVEAGVEVIARHLQREGVPHNSFSGNTAVNDRESIVRAFKNGNVRVVVMSPVGFEGLDLVGTTHVLVADPHYNPETTAQLVARATRAGGRVKEVHVRHYVSVCEKLKKGTIDEAIVRVATRKKSVNEMIVELLATQD
jgi:superfamily II DNA or RNA helicase